jgi:hypothetical protein
MGGSRPKPQKTTNKKKELGPQGGEPKAVHSRGGLSIFGGFGWGPPYEVLNLGFFWFCFFWVLVLALAFPLGSKIFGFGPRSKIQDFYPGSKKSFLRVLDLWSWIWIYLDPRFLPWIQEKKWITLDLGPWILTMSDLRFSSLNSFQAWDSEVKGTEAKAKTKHELQTKTSSEKFSFLFFFVVLSKFCWKAYPHPVRVAAVVSASYCTNSEFGWTRSR